MSAHKKKDGWILCRSKSFPGKFYYFNVFSGENAWNISDIKNKDITKDVNFSKNNNFECYPEQCSPSEHYSPSHSFCNVHNNAQKSYNHFVPQTLGLDQVSCPNYLTNTNQYVPNIIWTPLNLPSHIGIPNSTELNKHWLYHNCLKKDMEEKYVQTSDKNLTDLLVKDNNCNFNMSNNSKVVWKCYRDNNNLTEINNLCYNYNKLSVTQNSTSQLYKKQTLLKDPLLKLPSNFSSRNCTISSDSNNNLKDASFEKNKVFFDNANVLDKSDLRLFLAAKKKHQIKLRGLEGDANCTNNNPKQQSPAKKCVTFGYVSQIDENNVSCHENVIKEMDPLSKSFNICTFLNLQKFTGSSGEWFIVVDLNVLMRDFQYIIDTICRDETCRLMIVYAVLSKMWELSRLENKSFVFVLNARRIMRKITAFTQHIIIFEEDKSDDIPITKQILNCCKKLVEENYRLVMITDDTDLYSKGKSLNLDCYMIEEFKAKIRNTNLYTNKNIDILNNNTSEENNLFLQDIDTLKTFRFGQKKEAVKYNDSNKIKINYQNSYLKLIRKTIDNSDVVVRNNRNLSENLLSSFGNTENIFSRRNQSDTLANSTLSEKNATKLEGLNEKLKNFYLKNKTMEDRIALRMEEFICVFTQIMDMFMMDLIQKETSISVCPCTILEAADVIADLFHDHTTIQIIAYGMSAFYNLINPNGKLVNKIDHPNDVIKTIGCGQLLVEHIKNIKPDLECLADTENLLHQLICRIEDPIPDEISKENECMSNLELCRKENTVNLDTEGSLHPYQSPKLGFTKSPLEVLKYLQNHYPEWYNYSDVQEAEDKKEMIVYRTTGLNVNLLKITNSKKIVLDDKAAVVHNIENDRNEKGSDLDKYLDINITKLKKGPNDLEKIIKKPVQNEVSLKTHENTFTTNQNEDYGPKVVRKCGIITAFENKILKNPFKEVSIKSNNNVINTSENKTMLRKEKDEKLKKIVDEISVTLSDFADGIDITNKNEALPNQSNGDSRLGKDYNNGQAFIRSFLINLSSSLKVIYNFLNDSVLKIGKGNIHEDNKKEIFNKTDKTYKEVTVVIEKLKRIIERDQGEGTNMKLLLEVNANGAIDKRISRYQQVVTKCLEQAKILHQGLKVLLRITNENCDPLLISEPDDSNTGYYNIFE